LWVRRNHGPRRCPLRIFRVVEDSMRPTLRPGDWLLTVRGGSIRRGQLRVFRDPRLSTRWLIKRVGDVYTTAHGSIFEARSDNPGAPGSVDSHEFGPISAAGSYRVMWSARNKTGR
jgi:signal peptidase I